jgi:hypothetical protein
MEPPVCCLMVGFVMQMRLLPSVQPFHAIAYPIDAMLALEIRLGCAGFLLILDEYMVSLMC